MKKINRPWGYYQIVWQDPRTKVKIIVVKPKQSLSLQMHFKRSEKWTLLTGQARVRLGSWVQVLSRAGEEVGVQKRAMHRLTNASSKRNLVVLEVAQGKCLESDIRRFEDKYGRAKCIM